LSFGLGQLVGAGVGLYAQHKAKPDPIDPNKVYDMMSSPHNAEMHQRSQDMINPESALMQGMYNQAAQQGQDSLYTQNRMNRQNMAASGMGGQSGIANQMSADAATKTAGNLNNQFQNMMNQNLGASNQLLGTVTQNDMTARDAMTSAYGQNITNKNNWRSAMAGNVTKSAAQIGGSFDASQSGVDPSMIASLVMCDARMKENIKRIANVKIKGNHTIPLYQFTYKGRKKTHTNVMAQDVEKVRPQAVHTGKNGLKYVNTKELF
tara:strand:+ start:1160 stop:1951 length:792 start_codon:yes stop_codon:yes gene_type:complete